MIIKNLKINKKIMLKLKITFISFIALSFLMPASASQIEPISIKKVDSTPRIMYWYGKVNQHFNPIENTWNTDSDGVSGANISLLKYCQKFYPNTVSVKRHKEETIDTWRNRGNLSQFTATKTSYACVLENTSNIFYLNTSDITSNSAIINWLSNKEDISYISYWPENIIKPMRITTRALDINDINKEETVFCTMDVKLCPDGSYVSRQAPDCLFAPCPETPKLPVKDVETVIINELTNEHLVKIGKLKPNTKYYFQIHSFADSAIEEISTVYSFKTLPEKVVIIDNNYRRDIDYINIVAKESASLLIRDRASEILTNIGETRDEKREELSRERYLRPIIERDHNLSESANLALTNFITYGVDENTKKLGEGERAAVIHSYKSAYNRLPETEDDLADAIKIANGRWPSILNLDAEDRAKVEFRRIYKREALMENERDNAAITIMAYGLRQRAENRNLESEKRGIEIFKNIYGHLPQSTNDWNIMQAITYSGSSR